MDCTARIYLEPPIWVMCGSGAAIGLPPLASNAPAPRNPAGLWQAGGFWNSRVFILGEQFLSTQTPADLLPTKALQSSDFADGRTLLKVDDARCGARRRRRRVDRPRGRSASATSGSTRCRSA